MAQWEKHFLCKHDQSSDPQNSREFWVGMVDHLLFWPWRGKTRDPWRKLTIYMIHPNKLWMQLKK